VGAGSDKAIPYRAGKTPESESPPAGGYLGGARSLIKNKTKTKTKNILAQRRKGAKEKQNTKTR
jgi:hypothetical protein